MQELNISTLSGLLEFIAYQGRTGDAYQQELALDILRGVIETLPSQPMTLEDAVSVHALGISLTRAALASIGEPERMRVLLNYLLQILDSSGRVLEFMTGAQMADHQFFDDMTPTTVQ